MKLPEGLSEANFLEATERVLTLLASKFRFGYHEISDIKQQGYCFAIEVMSKEGAYDPKRPLENFLYTHLRNRFINYKRNNYVRNEPPCLSCIFYDPKRIKSSNQCAGFADKTECAKLMEWNKRNAVKRSIMQPLDMDGVADSSLQRTNDVSLDTELGELESLINDKLPLALRADYLRVKAGQTVPKGRKHLVRIAILAILNEYEGGDASEEN